MFQEVENGTKCGEPKSSTFVTQGQTEEGHTEAEVERNAEDAAAAEKTDCDVTDDKKDKNAADVTEEKSKSEPDLTSVGKETQPTDD